MGKIALPSSSSVEGAVARMVAVETRDPDAKDYSASDGLLAMQWMKLVLTNRLNHSPKQFLAPNAKDLIDIMRAPGQVAGFEQYPKYDAKLVKRLHHMIDIANNPAEKRRSVSYSEFLNNALRVANSPVVADPSLKLYPRSVGLCAWVKQGTRSPGSRYAIYQSVGGNSFYVLTH